MAQSSPSKALRAILTTVLGWLVLCISIDTQATIYVNLDLESSTVDAAIANGSTHDGADI